MQEKCGLFGKYWRYLSFYKTGISYGKYEEVIVNLR